MQMIWYWWFMVINATFNNISVTSWLSVLLGEETGVPRECMIFSATFIVIYEDILVGERYWCLSSLCSIYIYIDQIYCTHFLYNMEQIEIIRDYIYIYILTWFRLKIKWWCPGMLYDGHLEVYLRIGPALCQHSQWI